MTRPDDHELWRCEKCGKWSHAKRRPSHHRRFEKFDTDYGERVEERLCGPFTRYTARRDDPTPPTPSPRIGELLRDEEVHDDPNAGIEVPW